MGYYSDIAIVFSKDTNKLMLEELSKQPMETREEAKELLSAADVLYKGNSVMYHWLSVRWYTDVDHPGICWVQDFVNKLDDEDVRFVRIGEYSDDAEERGSYEVDIVARLSREIEIET